MLSDLNRFAFYFVRIGIDFAYYFVAEATFRLPCLFLLCIVFKVRGRQFVSLADSLVIIPHSPLLVNTFFQVFWNFFASFF